MFSICVPSYNSLPYLKILVKGLKKNTNTYMKHELIVHDNGSNDGTEQWLKENNIKYTKSDKNLGFCGVNSSIKNSTKEYIFLMNTDMYPLMGWDLRIKYQIEDFKRNDIDRFTISSCLIEPNGDNPEYDIINCGDNYSNFNEMLLLGTYYKECTRRFRKDDTVQWSHPILIPKFMLEEINYLDEQYFPGWNIDNDIPKSLYEKGCRNFCMLGNSRVYHFISKTFNQLPNEIKNKHGQDIFFKKWGLTTDEFRSKMGIRNKFNMVKNEIL